MFSPLQLLCHHGVKVITTNTNMNEQSYVPVKFYLQKIGNGLDLALI